MESAQHFKGKIALEKILLEDGWTIQVHDGEDSFVLLTPLGEREYWPDFLAWKDGEGWVVFEVDGKKGHWTKRDLEKMKLRDNAFRELDIRTVRIRSRDLVGKYTQPLHITLLEFSYQLA